jgi:Tol biopolymer transport system component
MIRRAPFVHRRNLASTSAPHKRSHPQAFSASAKSSVIKSPVIEKAIHALGARVLVSRAPTEKLPVEQLHDKTEESSNSAIFARALDQKTPARKITASAGAPHAESDITWSPDSRRVAFLSDAAKAGQAQLYVQSVPGQPAKRLTNVKGFLSTPKFSHDGKTLAVLFTENATRIAGPLAAETPETGEIKDAFFEQRLALIDIATGKFRQVSPADTYIYNSIKPDNLHLVVTSAPGNGDNKWYIAELRARRLTAIETALQALCKSPCLDGVRMASPSLSSKVDER